MNHGLGNAYGEGVVTAENIEAKRGMIDASDLRDEIVVGCYVWAVDGGYMATWPDGRAAVNNGGSGMGNSVWGTWIECAHAVLTDDGQLIGEDGQPEETTYRVYFADSGDEIYIYDVDSAEEAAREAVEEGGDWGRDNRTVWVSVRVTDCHGEWEDVKIAVQPHEPTCAEGHDHDWTRPIKIVGGIKENPGVFGHGGGVKIHDVCSHCGLHRWTDTWATDPSDGEQGLTSVEYRRDDEEES